MIMIDDNDDVKADGEFQTNKDIGVKAQMEGLNGRKLPPSSCPLWKVINKHTQSSNETNALLWYQQCFIQFSLSVYYPDFDTSRSIY